jgi:hypothetical protein
LAFSPRLHAMATCADLGTSHFGTGAEMGRVPNWGFMYDAQF